MATLLDAARDLFTTIDEAAARDDAAGRETLDDGVVAALVDAGLHAVNVPTEVGGAELPLTDVLDVVAEVSRADGSTGWCLMASASTVAFFGAYGGDGLVRDLFAGGVPLAAGQFAPNGTARPVEGGWRVTGDYRFGSGLPHAAWVGAGVMTEPDVGAEPEYRFAILPASAAEPHGNWDVLGLRRTASWDYTLRDAYVADDATFPFFAPRRRRGGPVYDLGVLGLVAVGHAGFAIGVGRRALDELTALAPTTHRLGASAPLHDTEQFLEELGTLEARLRAASAWVHETFGRAEHRLRESGPVATLDVSACRQATVHITREAADVTRAAYLLAGTTALRAGPLQRCFRDIHAATQHFFAGPAATHDFARALLDEQ